VPKRVFSCTKNHQQTQIGAKMVTFLHQILPHAKFGAKMGTFLHQNQ